MIITATGMPGLSCARQDVAVHVVTANPSPIFSHFRRLNGRKAPVRPSCLQAAPEARAFGQLRSHIKMGSRFP